MIILLLVTSSKKKAFKILNIIGHPPSPGMAFISSDIS
jgi:hypothetical protein